MKNLDCRWVPDRSNLIKFFEEAPAMGIEARLKYFHDVFSYAELLPAHLYLFDTNEISIACNHATIAGLGDKVITDYVDYTLPDYSLRKGWPRWTFETQLDNNRKAKIHGQSSGYEYTKDRQYIKKWTTKKEAIFNDDGRFIGIVGISLAAGVSSQTILIEREEKTAKITLSENKIVELSLREMMVLQAMLKGGTAQEIGLMLNLSPKTIETYMMRMRIKFNCEKMRDVITLLIQSELARDIMQCDLQK